MEVINSYLDSKPDKNQPPPSKFHPSPLPKNTPKCKNLKQKTQSNFVVFCNTWHTTRSIEEEDNITIADFKGPAPHLSVFFWTASYLMWALQGLADEVGLVEGVSGLNEFRVKILPKKKKKKSALIGQGELWVMWIINTLLKPLIFICLLHFCGEIISPGLRKGSCTLYIKIMQYMHFIWRGGASYLVSSINRHWINQCLCKNLNNICTCLIAKWCMTDEQHLEYLP